MEIDLTEVEVRLGSDLILDGVNLEVPSGCFLALVGPNGSGKTTLLRSIYYTLRGFGGTIQIGGTDVRTMRPRAAASRRAVVPQFQSLGIALTVAEIVATGTHARRSWWSTDGESERAAVEAALARVDALSLAQRRFNDLSGGERQKVMVARALAQDASTLLLDEPTNHLDVRAQLDLLQLISGLTMTRIAVLHDLDHAVAYADLVAVLEEGRLIAVGRPAEVLDDQLTRRVFGVRSRVITHPITGQQHLVTGPL
ncbi:iron complex transport system ATP-binding protein [Microbacterium sp. BE35]|uniref:ABC transporter ATP-binding protein n=1 Tax=Microbacterium sp. BE35 TaxID=2817773 RepID=UPI00285F3C51|nr:ABC transporter ATP-binding protein [Microbacterium sp. BE35]MDR7188162.1 iron complex transport system ATP-binding protein [Microbacterium sp. BE35]